MTLDNGVEILVLGFDLYLMNQFFGGTQGQWRAMEQANGDAKARAVGVSNFAPDQLLDLIIENEVVDVAGRVWA